MLKIKEQVEYNHAINMMLEEIVRLLEYNQEEAKRLKEKAEEDPDNAKYFQDEAESKELYIKALHKIAEKLTK